MPMHLEPCPFCGKRDLKVEGIKPHGLPEYDREYVVRCSDCNARGPMFCADGEHVVNAWNTRIRPTSYYPIIDG